MFQEMTSKTGSKVKTNGCFWFFNDKSPTNLQWEPFTISCRPTGHLLGNYWPGLSLPTSLPSASGWPGTWLVSGDLGLNNLALLPEYLHPSHRLAYECPQGPKRGRGKDPDSGWCLLELFFCLLGQNASHGQPRVNVGGSGRLVSLI
jgi:hypothetical protein